MRLRHILVRHVSPFAALALLFVLSAQNEFQCEPIDPIEPECVEAGGVIAMPGVPDALPCCEGLVEASQYHMLDGQCMALPGAMVCIAPSDGVCGPGEDRCNSPGDCNDVQECTPEGHSFGIYPGALPCCDGLEGVGCDAPSDDGTCMGCDGASFCTRCGDGECGLGENICRCPEDCGPEPDCTPEGESFGIYPGAPACCEGLTAVGCASPTASGECMPCSGASYCTACGDGECGAAENFCRCPEDCR